jgi:hypothetical protein
MRAEQHPSPIRVSLEMTKQDPLADRFSVPVEGCDVNEKGKLSRYRAKWKVWMSWHGLSGSDPNSIQSQIHRMLFNDLTYRAITSVRESVDTGKTISARSSTLAYLLDQGYVVSQVLSLQKLLDPGRGVISLRRLLKDVQSHRSLITREIYVAGDGHPYDYNSWSDSVDKADPMVRMWGIEAPGLARFATSKYLHEQFDLLSRKQAQDRTRDDTICKSIFGTLNGWISTSGATEIGSIRNNFVAHSADAVRRGGAQFTGVKLSQIDQLQRAIVRVERALTDHILSIRVGRTIVPSPPLGIFHGLDSPYSPPDAERLMHRRWSDLRKERDGWAQGIMEDLKSEPATAQS